MKNPRISAKERGLLKGAVRRVFSRSELRREVLAAAKTIHSDPKRPRVKTWYLCVTCRGFFAGFQMNVDHITPIIPLNSALENMSWDAVVDNTWCDASNLQAICLTCHKTKSKIENAERRKFKKDRG